MAYLDVAKMFLSAENSPFSNWPNALSETINSSFMKLVLMVFIPYHLFKLKKPFCTITIEKFLMVQKSILFDITVKQTSSFCGKKNQNSKSFFGAKIQTSLKEENY